MCDLYDLYDTALAHMLSSGWGLYDILYMYVCVYVCRACRIQYDDVALHCLP